MKEREVALERAREGGREERRGLMEERRIEGGRRRWEIARVSIDSQNIGRRWRLMCLVCFSYIEDDCCNCRDSADFIFRN